MRLRDYLPRQVKILAYVARGRVPWTPGYGTFRESYVTCVLSNRELMTAFHDNRPLLPKYGFALDERVIEYPWVLARLSDSSTMLLDAGSALNHSFLLNGRRLGRKTMVIYTLSPEGEAVYRRPNISYIYGDLRRTVLRDSVFEEAVCISAIEHVGLDSTRVYTSDPVYKESAESGFGLVMTELRRVLVPGGRLLLTVPYGRHQQLGWLQVFDRTTVQQVIATFGGAVKSECYYRYENAWQVADPAECAASEYHDPYAMGYRKKGSPAAAGAVACLELIR